MNSDTVYKVWLAGCRGLDARAQLVLSELFGGPEGVFRASERDLMQVMTTYASMGEKAAGGLIFRKDLSAAERLLEKAEEVGAGVLYISDSAYPSHLAGIPDPPALLWYKGDLKLIERPGVAVVGTRRCSPYGRWAAEEIAKRAARCGAVVISGMAEGIDSAGHKGCISAGGRTVAVFGTGIDICFPGSNRKLYDELQKNHLTLTEIEPGLPGKSWNFPQRNRIISGLSKSVIVVEGALKSGSMITAALAGEQGRDVLAVPGNINQPCSIGTNRLIMDGAVPVTDLDSLPQLLGLEVPATDVSRRPDLTKEEKELLALIKENNGQSAGLVASKSSLAPSDCLALISSLELKGLVNNRSNRLYTA